MNAEVAIRASDDLFRSGDLTGAAELVTAFSGDQLADLQLGAIQTAMVFFVNTPADLVSMTLAPHLDHPRALDLLGLAGFHETGWTRERDLAGPLNQCVTAGRGDFIDECWRADNRLHVGMIQQSQGYHDIAGIYLKEAYDLSSACLDVRASAARRLGIDAQARGDDAGAIQRYEESLSLRRQAGVTIHLPLSLMSLAEAVSTSDRERSLGLSQEAVDTARVVGLVRPLAHALYGAGKLVQDRVLVSESHELAESIGLDSLIRTSEALLEEMG